MRHTILIATATLLAAGAFVLFGGVLRESPSAGASALPAERVAAAFDPAFSSAQNAGSLVLRLQQQIRQSPDDAATHALLGLAYQQRARETGDSAYYPRAETVLRRAVELDEENAVAFSGLASLALSRHDFGEALVLARRARALAPTEARTLGAIGDALVELGRYREAFATFDQLARLKPGLAAYARVSYARELLGDRPGAVAAMRLAAETAVPGSEAAAWTALQLGKLFNSGGDPTSAERQFRIALAHVPGIRSRFRRPRLCRGRSRAAVPGDLPRNDGRSRPCPCLSTSPLSVTSCRGPAGQERPPASTPSSTPSTASSGRAASTPISSWPCSASTTTAGWRQRRTRRSPPTAARPSIDAADVAAWGLARSGRCVEAKRYSKLALRLRTQDSLKFFHRGMIERCLGDGVAAKRWLTPGARPQPRVLSDCGRR